MSNRFRPFLSLWHTVFNLTRTGCCRCCWEASGINFLLLSPWIGVNLLPSVIKIKLKLWNVSSRRTERMKKIYLTKPKRNGTKVIRQFEHDVIKFSCELEGIHFVITSCAVRLDILFATVVLQLDSHNSPFWNSINFFRQCCCCCCCWHLSFLVCWCFRIGALHVSISFSRLFVVTSGFFVHFKMIRKGWSIVI